MVSAQDDIPEEGELAHIIDQAANLILGLSIPLYYTERGRRNSSELDSL